MSDPEAEFGRIFTPAELSRLGDFTLKEKPRAVSLEKYHDVLTDAQVAEIDAMEADILVRVKATISGERPQLRS